MTTTKTLEKNRNSEQPAMRSPTVVSPEASGRPRAKQMLVKEKTLTRARDAHAAERRRMPWMANREGVRIRGAQGQG